jgi:hypothetical protein
MTRANLAKLATAGLALACAAALLIRWSVSERRAHADFPEGTFWVCGQCGQGFVKTIDELAAFYTENPDAQIPCLKCGHVPAVRALRCSHCGRFSARPARTSRAVSCPHCKKQLSRTGDVGE